MITDPLKRTGRRIKAQNLSIIVWDHARLVFLGTLDDAQWVEAVVQERSTQEDDWHDLECQNQIVGHVSPALAESREWRQHQYYITFYHEGQQYSGYASIRKPPTDIAQLHLDNGFDHIQ